MIEKIEDYNLLSRHSYEAIKKAINDGSLKAGEKVTETKLAKALGVSRTPVREALRVLYSEGYVRLTPNASFVVNDFTELDVREILQVRGALESEAARTAASLITPRDAAELRSTFRTMELVEEVVETEKEAFSFYSADVAFHEKILEIARNSHMISMCNSLRDRMYRMRIAIGKMPDSVRMCEQHHYYIMQAIIDGDGELAAKLSREHTDYIAEVVLPLCIDSM